MANTKVSISEDEFGKRLDRCLTDTIIKGSTLPFQQLSPCRSYRSFIELHCNVKIREELIKNVIDLTCGSIHKSTPRAKEAKLAGGLILGSILSLVFFKRRSWPILMGTGFGVGVAYRTCEKDLNS